MPRRATRIRRAAKALEAIEFNSWDYVPEEDHMRLASDTALKVAEAVLDRAGPSEPMGVAEVLEAFGVTDLRRVANRPTPIKVLKRGPIFDADEVRDLVRERKLSMKDCYVRAGRKGGLKGGKARAESLTPERRSEIARNAARARWDGD